MAKKKKYISTKSLSEDKTTMVSKVEIKNPTEDNQERISSILGTVFILLGLAFVIYGIVSFVKYTRNPQLDDSLQPPFIAGTDSITNNQEIEIKGVGTGYSDVMVYINDVEEGKAEVNKEGNFNFKYKASSEGKYSVTVAGIKGFPKRYLSPQSEVKIVEVDLTMPILGEINYSSEVGTSTFSTTGTVEPGCKVTVKRGTDIYKSECNDKGEFVMNGISLDEGPNVYSIEIEDRAGNITEVQEKIKVTYSPESSVNGDAIVSSGLNGDGVSDTSLPVASGEVGKALESIFGNKLMLIFGIVAIAAFLMSSGIVMLKRNEKVA